jgi:hypothetical protein
MAMAVAHYQGYLVQVAVVAGAEEVRHQVAGEEVEVVAVHLP